MPVERRRPSSRQPVASRRSSGARAIRCRPTLTTYMPASGSPSIAVLEDAGGQGAGLVQVALVELDGAQLLALPAGHGERGARADALPAGGSAGGAAALSTAPHQGDGHADAAVEPVTLVTAAAAEHRHARDGQHGDESERGDHDGDPAAIRGPLGRRSLRVRGVEVGERPQRGVRREVDRGPVEGVGRPRDPAPVAVPARVGRIGVPARRQFRCHAPGSSSATAFPECQSAQCSGELRAGPDRVRTTGTLRRPWSSCWSSCCSSWSFSGSRGRSASAGGGERGLLSLRGRSASAEVSCRRR